MMPRLPLAIRRSPAADRTARSRWHRIRRRPGGWPALYAAALVITAGGLVLGFAAAAEIVTGSGSGSASTGTVALRINGSGSRACDYGLLAPGDLTGSATCALSVRYRGSIRAHLSVTVRIMSKSDQGGKPLFDGTNTGGLTMMISDGHHSFTVPTGPGTRGGSCPARFTCWTARNDLAAAYRGGSPDLVFGDGDTATFTVTPLFLSAAAPLPGRHREAHADRAGGSGTSQPAPFDLQHDHYRTTVPGQWHLHLELTTC